MPRPERKLPRHDTVWPLSTKRPVHPRAGRPVQSSIPRAQRRQRVAGDRTGRPALPGPAPSLTLTQSGASVTPTEIPATGRPVAVNSRRHGRAAGSETAVSRGGGRTNRRHAAAARSPGMTATPAAAEHHHRSRYGTLASSTAPRTDRHNTQLPGAAPGRWQGRVRGAPHSPCSSDPPASRPAARTRSASCWTSLSARDWRSSTGDIRRVNRRQTTAAPLAQLPSLLVRVRQNTIYYKGHFRSPSDDLRNISDA